MKMLRIVLKSWDQAEFKSAVYVIQIGSTEKVLFLVSAIFSRFVCEGADV